MTKSILPNSEKIKDLRAGRPLRHFISDASRKKNFKRAQQGQAVSASELREVANALKVGVSEIVDPQSSSMSIKNYVDEWRDAVLLQRVCEKDVVDLMEMLATNPMLYFHWSICPDRELANELSDFANFLHSYSLSTRHRDGGDEPSGPDYVRPLGRIVTALRMCKEHGIFVYAGQYLRVGVCSVELKLWEVPLSTTSLELPCERSSMHIMLSTKRSQYRRVDVHDQSVEDSFVVAFALNNKNSFWTSFVRRIAEDPKLRPSFGPCCRPLHLEEFARFCEMAIESDDKDDLDALGKLVPRAFETD